MKWTALGAMSVFACAAPVRVAPRRQAPAPVVSSPKPAAIALRGRVWLASGPLQLEPGGVAVQPVREGDAIEADVVEDQGRLVRVNIHLPHVDFEAWSERARLYAIVLRDTHMNEDAFAESGIEVSLRRGARVRRLAHDHARTLVRYYGQLEVEGWIPDAAIAESGPARDTSPRMFHGGDTLTLLPGTVFRTEPKWAARALATSAEGYFAETVKEIDNAWVLAEYEDGDVRVRGYVSKQGPPGRVHRPHVAQNAQVIAANGKLPASTCLYARERGEPIGVVGVQGIDAELAPGRAGWFSAAIDTPWGPITFAVAGPALDELAPCDSGASDALAAPSAAGSNAPRTPNGP